MKSSQPKLFAITSGASEDPPMPARTIVFMWRNFAVRASISGRRVREVSGRSTQFNRTAASAAASGPQVDGSFCAICLWTPTNFL